MRCVLLSLKFSSQFNNNLTAIRQENNEGLYDIHTNTIQWPRTMQPTHARWERVPHEKTNQQYPKQHKLTNGASGNGNGPDVDQELSTIFQALDPIYPRNFLIQDLCLEGAPESKFGPPGLDNNPQSLSNISQDILDELPTDCRQAFEEAKARESTWRSRWNTETTDGKRGRFMPTVEWFP